jgi:hypothetical protein
LKKPEHSVKNYGFSLKDVLRKKRMARCPFNAGASRFLSVPDINEKDRKLTLSKIHLIRMDSFIYSAGWG